MKNKNRAEDRMMKELRQRIADLEALEKEHKRVEEALRESEERFRAIYEGSNDAVMLLNETGFLDCNLRALKMFGFKNKEEFIGIHLVDISPPTQPNGESSFSAAQERIQTAYRQGDSRFEWMHRRANGEDFLAEVVLSTFDLRGRRIQHVVVRDITERKRTENRLARINECFMGFGSHFEENINRLVAVCGELLNGTCTLYNRLQDNQLCSVGQWRTPADYKSVDPPEGHICYDVIRQGKDSPIVIRHLRQTIYAQTDPNVSLYGLSTYIGVAVKWRQVAIGSLCVVYQADVEPSPEDLNVLKIVAAAIGVEEERMREEAALVEKERYFRSLLYNIHEDIVVIDPDYRITDLNDSVLRTLGYGRDEIIGRSCFEVFHGFNIPCAQKGEACSLRQAFETGEPQNCRHEHIRRDGSKVYVDIQVSPLKNNEGKVTSVIEAMRDLSDLILAEEALRKSEEKFRELYDHAPVGYHEYDLEGRITNVNRTDLEMLGYTAEEVIGQPVWKFNAEEELARGQILAKLAGTLPPARNLERAYRRKDGTAFPVMLVDRLILDEKGGIKGIRCTVQDMTEQKRAEREKSFLQEQLRQAQKMEAIGQLAGGIAHDFNNILTIINGRSELALLKLIQGDPLRGNIEEIKKAGERATSLTQQLLAFSRRQILEFRVLDLNAILLDLDKMLRRVIGEDIELVTFLGKDLGKVKTDPGQVEQMILNLAVNARDAMPNGGKFILETVNVELDEEFVQTHGEMKSGPYVRLSVSDTGLGMTPEVKERIFEPFFTMKEKGKGTGLGLSTVYGIVKQSEGNISVYSEPGKGTTFKVYLPRIDEPLEEVKQKEEAGQIPRGKETVLVVEDDEAVRGLAVLILRKQGYRVLEALNSGEGFLVCDQHQEPIHLILTDVVMPRMNGPEFIDRLKQMRQDFKVLYMSGYTDEAVVYRGVRRGEVRFIQKPFTLEGLSRKVREVLDKG